jgi:hypothetical protein
MLQEFFWFSTTTQATRYTILMLKDVINFHNFKSLNKIAIQLMRFSAANSVHYVKFYFHHGCTLSLQILLQDFHVCWEIQLIRNEVWAEFLVPLGTLKD